MFKELKFTLSFVTDFITQNNLVDLYQQLISFYQQAQSDYNEEVQKNIEGKKDEITKIHSQINYSAWSTPKISILKQIKAYDLMGISAISRINEIFAKSFGNINIIVQKLEELKNETNSLNSKVTQLIKEMSLEEIDITIEEGKQVIEINFEEEATLNNFWDIKDRANEWIYIIRTVTRLTNQPFESAKIFSINTSSPIAIDVETVKNSAEALTAIAKAAATLKMLKDKFFKKKKDAEDLELSKDTFKMVIKDLEQRNKEGYEQKIGELSVEITKQHRIAKDGVDDGNEIENMVKIALEKMTTLITEGVRIVDPSEIKPQGEVLESSLSATYSEMKKIEEEIKPLLEADKQKLLEARREEMLKEIEEPLPKKRVGRPPKEKAPVNEQTEEKVEEATENAEENISEEPTNPTENK